MTSPTLRFYELDFLRGMACLSVLAFHFLARGPRHDLMPGVDFPLAAAVFQYGYLGVHLFFVLSGFVIFMSAEGATVRSFAASRASRLYPGLWAAATLTAGAAWLLGDQRFQVPVVDYLANLSMVPHWFNLSYVDGAYWSLAYELLFYILVGLAIAAGLLPRVEQLMAGWLLVSVVNLIWPTWPVEFWLAAKWAPLFVAGGVFYRIRQHGLTPFRLALLGAAFDLAQVYAGLYDPPEFAVGAQATTVLWVQGAVLSAIFVLFWLVATGRFKMRASPFAYYAGALTYPLYLVHQNLGTMLYERLYRASNMVLASLALMLVCVFALSWCVYTFVERPLGRRLRRWLEGRRRQNTVAPEGVM